VFEIIVKSVLLSVWQYDEIHGMVLMHRDNFTCALHNISIFSVLGLAHPMCTRGCFPLKRGKAART
jgi:hypothetical protein